MYGAFIGDIVGSKYEFNNIKTKQFPLFSQGCDYTDDTIMTAAVAKAIMLSRDDQHNHNENGRPFQSYLIEVMQDFGRRYPHPTGAYGGSFAKWLRQSDPKPYGSFGNGSAMRVSPCGLAAVTLDEALALARASACVTHNHPEGIKGAEAVAAAVFLAKSGNSKAEIRSYISEHYYNLDFTLDSIRDTYQFDSSCQGSVPQAIVAFLESESFEDAIRNVISIGGDTDTTGAITGSIAWIYYAGYIFWVTDHLSAPMQELRAQAKAYLPAEFIEIEEEFLNRCSLRSAAFNRGGSCSYILNRAERETYDLNWPKSPVRSEPKSPVLPKAKSPVQQACTSSVSIEKRIKDAMIRFCSKYVVLMKVLYRDQELNRWCRRYSTHHLNLTHSELKKIIYGNFLHDFDAFDFIPEVLSWRTDAASPSKAALPGAEKDLIYGIVSEIRKEHEQKGALLSQAIGEGTLYRLMRDYLSLAQTPRYTQDYIEAKKNLPNTQKPGACRVRYDEFTKQWSLYIQLDQERLWFLSVFIRDDGSLENYSLDEENACDSHYYFVEEQEIRKKLYAAGDEHKYFHEILIRYIEAHGGNALLNQIMPYVTEQFHFD